MRFRGQPYLVDLMLPNLNFRATTAYDILRHNGVGIGIVSRRRASVMLYER